MKIIRTAELSYLAASHEDPKDPGVLKKVLLERHALLEGRVQMVNWALLPVGRSFRPHYHEDMQELFVIVRGEVEVHVGAGQERLRRGDAILIDPEEVHEMKNESGEDAEYLVVGISAGRGGKTVVV